MQIPPPPPPLEFLEQAIRDKITFSCSDDRSKLKLYDEGATLSVTRAIEIMSLREATTRELQEFKTVAIDSVHSPTDQQKKFQGRPCGYCSKVHPPGKEKLPRRSFPVVTKARKLATFQLSAEALVLPKRTRWM